MLEQRTLEHRTLQQRTLEHRTNKTCNIRILEQKTL